jgi:hypothetical protein
VATPKAAAVAVTADPTATVTTVPPDTAQPQVAPNSAERALCAYVEAEHIPIRDGAGSDTGLAAFARGGGGDDGRALHAALVVMNLKATEVGVSDGSA